MEKKIFDNLINKALQNQLESIKQNVQKYQQQNPRKIKKNMMHSVLQIPQQAESKAKEVLISLEDDKYEYIVPKGNIGAWQQNIANHHTYRFKDTFTNRAKWKNNTENNNLNGITNSTIQQSRIVHAKTKPIKYKVLLERKNNASFRDNNQANSNLQLTNRRLRKEEQGSYRAKTLQIIHDSNKNFCVDGKEKIEIKGWPYVKIKRKGIENVRIDSQREKYIISKLVKGLNRQKTSEKSLKYANRKKILYKLTLPKLLF